MQQQVCLKCCSSSWYTNLRKRVEMKRWGQPREERQWKKVQAHVRSEKGCLLLNKHSCFKYAQRNLIFIDPVLCLTPTNLCFTFVFLISCFKVTIAVSLSAAITPILTFTQPLRKACMIFFLCVSCGWGQRDRVDSISVGAGGQMAGWEWCVRGVWLYDLLSSWNDRVQSSVDTSYVYERGCAMGWKINCVRKGITWSFPIVSHGEVNMGGTVTVQYSYSSKVVCFWQ